MSHLLASKARTVPIKQVDTLTIPRKELLAAPCGARLLSHVKEVLKLTEVTTLCWTDSANVLAWIQTPKEHALAVFVQNRVREIRRLTDPKSWHHVAGLLNPADLPSRGAPLSKLIGNSLWLKGSRVSPIDMSSVTVVENGTEALSAITSEGFRG